MLQVIYRICWDNKFRLYSIFKAKCYLFRNIAASGVQKSWRQVREKMLKRKKDI